MHHTVHLHARCYVLLCARQVTETILDLEATCVSTQHIQAATTKIDHGVLHTHNSQIIIFPLNNAMQSTKPRTSHQNLETCCYFFVFRAICGSRSKNCEDYSTKKYDAVQFSKQALTFGETFFPHQNIIMLFYP
jgi:hypothetical protein